LVSRSTTRWKWLSKQRHRAKWPGAERFRSREVTSAATRIPAGGRVATANKDTGFASVRIQADDRQQPANSCPQAPNHEGPLSALFPPCRAPPTCVHFDRAGWPNDELPGTATPAAEKLVYLSIRSSVVRMILTRGTIMVTAVPAIAGILLAISPAIEAQASSSKATSGTPVSPFDPNQPSPGVTTYDDIALPDLESLPTQPPSARDPDATSRYPDRQGPGGTGDRHAPDCNPPPVSAPPRGKDCTGLLRTGDGYGDTQDWAVIRAEEDLEQNCQSTNAEGTCGVLVQSSCQNSDGSWYAYVLGYCAGVSAAPLPSKDAPSQLKEIR
jgi:hypothetical protein